MFVQFFDGFNGIEFATCYAFLLPFGQLFGPAFDLSRFEEQHLHIPCNPGLGRCQVLDMISESDYVCGKVRRRSGDHGCQVT